MYPHALSPYQLATGYEVFLWIGSYGHDWTSAKRMKPIPWKGSKSCRLGCWKYLVDDSLMFYQGSVSANEALNQRFYIRITRSSSIYTCHCLAVSGHPVWWKGMGLWRTCLNKKWGNKPGVVDIPSLTPGRYIDSNGIQRICGDCDLKASQHYPARFGCAITEVFLENYEMIKKTSKETRKALKEKPKKEAKD